MKRTKDALAILKKRLENNPRLKALVEEERVNYQAALWRVLDRVVADTKAKNTRVPAKKLAAAIDESVHPVRAEHFRRKA